MRRIASCRSKKVVWKSLFLILPLGNAKVRYFHIPHTVALNQFELTIKTSVVSVN